MMTKHYKNNNSISCQPVNKVLSATNVEGQAKRNTQGSPQNFKECQHYTSQKLNSAYFHICYDHINIIIFSPGQLFCYLGHI